LCGRADVSGDDVLRLAVSLERLSEHLGAGIVRGRTQRNLQSAAVEDFANVAGKGIRAASTTPPCWSVIRAFMGEEAIKL